MGNRGSRAGWIPDMRLNDIRRLAVRRKVRIGFVLSNGMECVIDEHGISRVPKLNGPFDLNVETELATASAFSMQPVGGDAAKGGGTRMRPLRREELEALAAEGAGASGNSIPEHEE